ncbi:MAG: hypothetical protein NTV79_12135, partial [Candidatus Aureabacteria bacterium]|nr:hypothetical protein [Candidatus Auribacterota bacterium]
MLLKTLSYAVIALISVCLVIVYTNTFRDHLIYHIQHGPFNFESGVYVSYAIGRIDLHTTDNDKLTKHFLCASLFPVFHRLVRPWRTADDSPLVCSALTGLAIAIFGCWLFRRTQSLGLTLPIILLLGFSFTTWY